MPWHSKLTKNKLLSIAHARGFRSSSGASSVSSTPATGSDYVPSASPSRFASPIPSHGSFSDLGAPDMEDEGVNMSLVAGSMPVEDLPPGAPDNPIELGGDDEDDEDDDLIELEGLELQQSLQMRMEVEEAELEVLKKVQERESAKELTGYNELLVTVSKEKWKQAESNRSLGYNGRSKRTHQRNEAKVEGEKAKQTS